MFGKLQKRARRLKFIKLELFYVGLNCLIAADLDSLDLINGCFPTKNCSFYVETSRDRYPKINSYGCVLVDSYAPHRERHRTSWVLKQLEHLDPTVGIGQIK